MHTLQGQRIPNYTHTYIYIYIYVINIKIHVCVYVCVHHLHTYIHTYIHSYIHTFIQSYSHTVIHSYIHTFIQSYSHTVIHSYIRTYVRTDRQTDRHTCNMEPLVWILLHGFLLNPCPLDQSKGRITMPCTSTGHMNQQKLNMSFVCRTCADMQVYNLRFVVSCLQLRLHLCPLDLHVFGRLRALKLNNTKSYQKLFKLNSQRTRCQGLWSGRRFGRQSWCGCRWRCLASGIGNGLIMFRLHLNATSNSQSVPRLLGSDGANTCKANTWEWLHQQKWWICALEIPWTDTK